MLYTCLVFGFTYLSDPNRPGAIWEKGWYEVWFDQRQYLDMVNGMAHGHLGAFQYPPLYPILARVTWIFGPDPFLAINLVLFCCFIWFYFQIFQKFLTPMLSLAATVVLIHSAVAYFETPWTTTISAAALGGILFLLICRTESGARSLLLGVLIAALFGARVGDVVIGLAVMTTAAFWQSRRATAITLLVFAVGAGAILALNYTLTGSLLGRYAAAVRAQGFNPLAAPWKLYGYIIDPFLLAGETHPASHPAIAILPALLLSPAGLLCLWRKHRRIARLLLAAIASWLMIYGSFVAVSGLTLRYHSIHYMKMLFPILIGAALLMVQEIVDKPVSMRSMYAYVGIVAAFLLWPRIPGPQKLRMQVSAGARSDQAWKAIDGDAATRWDSGAPQQPGMHFDIDLGRPRMVYRITADTLGSPGDFGRDLALLTSDDGVRWQAVSVMASSGPSSAFADYRLDPMCRRYWRLQVQGTSPNWWSIHELAAYTP